MYPIIMQENVEIDVSHFVVIFYIFFVFVIYIYIHISNNIKRTENTFHAALIILQSLRIVM